MADSLRYPGFANKWRIAFNLLYENRKANFNPEKDDECSVDKWPNGDAMFEWWLTRKGDDFADENQSCFMFE